MCRHVGLVFSELLNLGLLPDEAVFQVFWKRSCGQNSLSNGCIGIDETQKCKFWLSVFLEKILEL